MKTAIVHGCYNTTNFGDLLLLEMVSKYLLDKWNIRSETLRLPDSIKLEYCQASKSIFSAARPDYAVFGGGGYLEDNNGSPVATKVLLRYLYPAQIWTALGVPYAIIGPGGGPSAIGKGAKRLKWICSHASRIAIRDEISASFVAGLGVDKSRIVTTADIALTLKAEDIPQHLRFDMPGLVGRRADGKKIIGIHLEKIYDDPELFEQFCDLEFLSDKALLEQFHFVFFYDYKSANVEAIKTRLEQYVDLNFSIQLRINHWTTADFLRQCDAVITTKLHVSIVSATLGVPVFGFSFHEKTARFFKQIGRSDFQRMWSDGIQCINEWVYKLYRKDIAAWNLSDSHMKAIKDAAWRNFDVLDEYVKSRK